MQLTTDRGIVKLYDGTVVYIVDIQYSTNGQTYWEDVYNPNTHFYQGDGVTELGPHKYMRVKHSDDTNYQQPMYISAIDGENIELTVDDGYIKWKVESSEVWTNLIEITELKGDKGEKGDKGDSFTVDYAGALDQRPNFDTSDSTSFTFASFGNHILTTDEIGTYFSNDGGSTWTEVTSGLVGTYAEQWGAPTDSGASAYTCNSLGQVVFAPYVAPYDSTGKVYAWLAGRWSADLDLTVTTGQVKVSAGDALEFLNQKVDGSTLTSYDSNSLGYSDKIKVKAGGITNVEINSNALGDGLTGGSGTDLSVTPSSFVGSESHCLETFTHSNNTTDIRFDPTDMIGDGLKIDTATVGAETVGVDVTDLVITTTDGLTTYTAGDGKNNLRVLLNASSALEITSTGLAVKPDASTTEINGSNQLAVKALGIQYTHLNSNTADGDRGIEKNGTSGKIAAKLDSNFLEFSGGNITIKDDSITGVKLSSTAVDGTKGMQLLADKLAVLVDSSTIGFNGSGQLTLLGINGASIIANQVVKGIRDEGATVTLQDTLTLKKTDTTYIDVALTFTGASDTIDISATLDYSTLKTNLQADGFINTNVTPVAVSWASITGSASDSASLVNYVTGITDTKLTKDTDIEGVKWVTVIAPGFPAKGLWFKSPNGTWYRLKVDDSGNFFSSTNS